MKWVSDTHVIFKKSSGYIFLNKCMVFIISKILSTKALYRQYTNSKIMFQRCIFFIIKKNANILYCIIVARNFFLCGVNIWDWHEKYIHTATFFLIIVISCGFSCHFCILKFHLFQALLQLLINRTILNNEVLVVQC